MKGRMTGRDDEQRLKAEALVSEKTRNTRLRPKSSKAKVDEMQKTSDAYKQRVESAE